MSKPTKKCLISACENAIHSRGMCSKHYYRWRVHGNPNKVMKKRYGDIPCAVQGCGKPRRKRDWCEGHYDRFRKYGTVDDSACAWVIEDYDECLYCGDAIGDAGEFRRYCSRSCAVSYSINKKRRPADSKCGTCGSEIDLMSRHESGRRKYASTKTCRECRSPKLSHYVPKLQERDGNVCGLCLEEIDLTVEYPDPLSVSVDHVYPRSLGGGEELSNLQLSHLACNVKKQNKVL